MKRVVLKLKTYSTLIMFCLVLISCGGGGDSSEPDTPPVKNATQLTQSDFNVANVKSLTEGQFQTESSENGSFKNMDNSMEANPQNDVNNNNSMSSQFSLSSAGTESFEECFNRKTSAATFQPDEKGGFKATLGNTEIGDCLGSMFSIIYSFAYDQVKVRDSQGAYVDLEGKTLTDLFDPSNNYNPAQFNLREHAQASIYGITASVMISANSTANFNDPCLVPRQSLIVG